MARRKVKKSPKKIKHSPRSFVPNRNGLSTSARNDNIVLSTKLEESRSEISLEQCYHRTVFHNLNWSYIKKNLVANECTVCHEKNGELSLCLNASCMLILCDAEHGDHAAQHFDRNSEHIMQLRTTSKKVCCMKCNREIGPADIDTKHVEHEVTDSSCQTIMLKPGLEVNATSKVVANAKGGNSSSSLRGRKFNDRGVIQQIAIRDIYTEEDKLFPRGLTGLENLGNTCYMNAALQALSNCPPLAEFFRSASSLLPFASHSFSMSGCEPPVSQTFRKLLQAIWSPTRVGCVSPYQLLTQVRGRCSQFRGWAQQDSQEFIRCFLDLLHRELSQPVFAWEHRYSDTVGLPLSLSRARALSTSSSLTSKRMYSSKGARLRRRSSSASTSSACSMADVEQYETADSGCGSDGDSPSRDNMLPPSMLMLSKPRKRGRCNSSGHFEVSVNCHQSVSESHLDDKRPISRTDLEPNALDNIKPLCTRSIVSEVFDGEIESTVKCLTCHHLSKTRENFQDLSLSIPTRQQVDRLTVSRKCEANFHCDDGDLIDDVEDDCSDEDQNMELNTMFGDELPPTWQWPWWLGGGWLQAIYDWLTGTNVTLTDAVRAFFSPDNLRGENMYSCEKCSKLRNGVKVCRITRLPEILCIHLKRFRHDFSSSSKVTTTVTFPLCDLDMSPFVSRSSQKHNANSLYDLRAFITHRGGRSESGHYLAYCKNEIDECWYEFDDSVVTRLEPAEVMLKEAYVLFYQKQPSDDMDGIRDKIKDLVDRESDRKDTLRFSPKYYISREWLHRLSTFAWPGPITNHDFLCEHAQILPRRAAAISEYYAVVGLSLWDFLRESFGGGPQCTELRYCIHCQKEYYSLKLRRENELSMFKALDSKLKMQSLRFPELTYGHYMNSNALSKRWFLKWKAFVNGEEIEPPGPIDNSVLLNQCDQNSRKFLRSTQYIPVERELWLFFAGKYGGGPEVYCSSEPQPTDDEIKENIARIDALIDKARESLTTSKVCLQISDDNLKQYTLAN